MPRWLRAGLIIGVAVTLALLGRGHHGHLLVDFGRELYFPWRLTEGDVLYRDLASFHGPLSAWWNALWFELLGVSLRTLVLANAVVIGALVLAIQALVRRAAGADAACFAALLFLLLFASRQLETIGNYQFLSPYSHELTHGLLLSLLSLACFVRSPTPLTMVGAGLLAGAVALTKAEHLAALLPALGVGLGLRAWRGELSARTLGLFLATLPLPALATTLWLAQDLPLGEALRGTLASLAGITDSELTSLPYYQHLRGTDDVAGSLARGGWLLLGWLAALAGAAALARLLAGRGAPRTGALVAAVVGVGVALWLPITVWVDLPRPLPLVLPLFLVAALPRARTAERDPDGRCLLVAVSSVYALLLLAKVLLRARLDHYGFVLALPGTLLVAVAAASGLSRFLGARGLAGTAAGALIVGLLAGAAGRIQVHTAERRQGRAQVLGEGADRFTSGPPAGLVRQVLEQLEDNLAPGQTFAVFPEGVMWNYLLRTANPTPYINFMPPEFVLFDEAAMIAAYAARPPDLAVLVHRPAEGYGTPFFGRDFGVDLMDWIRREYRRVALFGDPPLRPGSRFGVEILARVPR